MKQNIKELEQTFDNELSKYDQTTKTFHHKLSQYVTLNNLDMEIRAFKNPNILDGGCGTGTIAVKLLKDGYNVVLLDISSKNIEIARKKIENENLNTKYYIGNCEETTFENDTFDIVMLNGAVISYTPNPEKLLREANRILKKNGMIWFDFFNSAGWALEMSELSLACEIAKSELKLIQMPDWKYPARVFSLEYIEKLVQKNGFLIKNEYGLINLTHAMNLNIRYSDNITEDLIKKYQEIELEYSRDKRKIGLAWSCIISGIKK